LIISPLFCCYSTIWFRIYNNYRT